MLVNQQTYMNNLNNQHAYYSMSCQSLSNGNPQKTFQQSQDKIKRFKSNNQSNSSISSTSSKQYRFNAKNVQANIVKNSSQKNLLQYRRKAMQNNYQILHFPTQSCKQRTIITSNIDRIIANEIIPTLNFDPVQINISNQDVLLIFISNSKQKEKQLQLKVSLLERQLKAASKALGYINSSSNSMDASRVIPNQHKNPKSLIEKFNQQQSNEPKSRVKTKNQTIINENKLLQQRNMEMEVKISMLKMQIQKLVAQLNKKNSNQNTYSYSPKMSRYNHFHANISRDQLSNRKSNYVSQLQLNLQSKDLQIRALKRLVKQNNCEQMEKKLSEMIEIVKRKDHQIQTLEQKFSNLQAQKDYYKNQVIQNREKNNTGQFIIPTPDIGSARQQQQSFTSFGSSKDQKNREKIKKQFGEMLVKLDKKVKNLQTQLRHRQHLIQYAEKTLNSMLNLSGVQGLKRKLDFLWEQKKDNTEFFKFIQQKKQIRLQSKQGKVQRRQKEPHENGFRKRQLAGKFRLNVIKQSYQDEMASSFKII